MLVTIDIRADELLEEIERVYDEKLIEQGIVDLDYARESLYLSKGENQDEDEIKTSLLSPRHRYKFPKEIVEMLQSWACFDAIKTQATSKPDCTVPV